MIVDRRSSILSLLSRRRVLLVDHGITVATFHMIRYAATRCARRIVSHQIPFAVRSLSTNLLQQRLLQEADPFQRWEIFRQSVAVDQPDTESFREVLVDAPFEVVRRFVQWAIENEVVLDPTSIDQALQTYQQHIIQSTTDTLHPSIEEHIHALLLQHNPSQRARTCELWIEAILKTDPVDHFLAHDLLSVLSGRMPIPGSEGLYILKAKPSLRIMLHVLDAWRSIHNMSKVRALEQWILEDYEYKRPYDLNVALKTLAPHHSHFMLELMTNHAHLLTGESYVVAMRSLKPQDVYQVWQKLITSHEPVKQVHWRLAMQAWIPLCASGHVYHYQGEKLYPAEYVELILRECNDRGWILSVPEAFALAMEAWCKQKSNSIEPIVRAKALLELLRDRAPQVPAIVANWFIRLCAGRHRTIQRRFQAFDMAMDCYEKSDANWFTFILVVQLLHRRYEKEPSRLQQELPPILTRACQTRMLTQDLIWQIAHCASDQTIAKVFGCRIDRTRLSRKGGKVGWRGSIPRELDLAAMPPVWSENAFSGRVEKRDQFW